MGPQNLYSTSKEIWSEHEGRDGLGMWNVWWKQKYIGYRVLVVKSKANKPLRRLRVDRRIILK